MVARIVVGAHYGLTAWLAQRITALVMVLFTVVVTVLIVTGPPLDHARWQALFAPQWFRVLALLFLLSLFWHTWVGMRDIIMDYVQPVGIKLALEVLVLLALVVYALWSVTILWS